MQEASYSDQDSRTEVVHSPLDATIVEYDPKLFRLVRHLYRKTGSRPLKTSDIMMTDVGEVDPDLVGMVHVVDVSATSSDEFYFSSYGFRAGQVFGFNFERRAVREIKSCAFRLFVGESYSLAKKTGAPWISRVKTRQLGFRSSYSRLMFPLRDDRGDVSHVLVAISRHSHVIF